MDLSIVISTYNRCALLEAALQAVLALEGDLAFEAIVVDNNSTDQTQLLAKSLAAQFPDQVRYVFEPKQGLSHGRNAGIAHARSPIVAFTDDDVRVAPDWAWQISQAFQANPDIDFLGGKVLPKWPAQPPAWLTKEHWAPLALLDYGDQPFYVDSGTQLCLIGANIAFRKRAFDIVGLFAPDVQRVRAGIGSLEDHEMLLRLWRANRRGLYLPQLVVTAEVEPERLDQNYHRKWHAGHGRFYAMLASDEVEHSKLGRLFGVPAHLYRRAFNDAWGWTVATMLKRPEQAFRHEVRLRYFGGFLNRRSRDFFRRRAGRTSG